MKLYSWAVLSTGHLCENISVWWNLIRKERKTFHGKNRLRRFLSLWSDKILFTARLFQVVLEYRQVEKGVILNKMSECSSRNPSAGEEMILKWAQKNLPIEVIKSKPLKLSTECHANFFQPFLAPITFIPPLSVVQVQENILMNKGSSTWQICFPEWDLMDHCQHLPFEWPSEFLWEQIGTGSSGEHCPHWKADVQNAPHESLPQLFSWDWEGSFGTTAKMETPKAQKPPVQWGKLTESQNILSGKGHTRIMESSCWPCQLLTKQCHTLSLCCSDSVPFPAPPQQKARRNRGPDCHPQQ